MTKTNMTIDGRTVTVDEGATILEAAKTINVRVPTLCHLHLEDLQMLNQVASCRICVVEVAGRKPLLPACATPVAEGMEVRTNSKRVLAARRAVLELLLSDHPTDCLICVKSTNCELQKLASDFAIDRERFRWQVNNYPEDTSSQALKRDPNKCIMCRRCETMCSQIQTVGVLTANGRGFEAIVGPAGMKPVLETNCTYCGQCVTVCPTGALTGVSYVQDVWEALFDTTKTVVVQVAPAIRAAIGEEFEMAPGTAIPGRLAAGLRHLGFDAVFDTTFGADLTIMEESREIVERLHDGHQLPLLTSCCPGWINFLEFQFPDLRDIASSCKSPQQMVGTIAKTYYAERIGKRAEDIVMVAVMPCLAKKYEAARPEHTDSGVPDVDYVITTRELSKMLKEAGIDLRYIEDEPFDNPLGESTGAGVIFGATGGVLEAALRTVYEQVNEKELEDVNFTAVRGMQGVKEAEVRLNGKVVRVAAASGLGNARKLLTKIEKGESTYDVIEIMACPGGCINGGGQPYSQERAERIQARIEALYAVDEGQAVRKSHQNSSVQRLYDEYLGEPGSEKAHKLLHTVYFRR
jgi:NADH-quinone oxidoreductase subunit G